MSYKAIITPLMNIREHPGADRLRLATVASHQIIIGLTEREGELGVFFPEGGQVTEEFLKNNNLYRHADKNIDPSAKAGFFDDNGRVRIQKFRGEISEGFWTGLESLAWAGDITKLKQGDLLDSFNKQKICQKYITKATREAQGLGKQLRGSGKREVYPMFKEHWDTQKLRYLVNTIPENSVIYISEKCHGTSGRTGRVMSEKRAAYRHLVYTFLPAFILGFLRKRKLKKLAKGWIRLFDWISNLSFQIELVTRKVIFYYKIGISKLFGIDMAPGTWKYVSGTRRTIVQEKTDADTGFYSGKRFRIDVHKKIKEMGLKKGETIYYEIVGHSEDGSLIMPAHKIGDKKLKKQYGDKMIYSYGCESDVPELCYRVLVYRITVTNEDGEAIDLTIPQIRNRCRQLGLETVPYLKGPFIFPSADELMLQCRALAEGVSVLDSSHIKEGVAVRVESEKGITDYKFKSLEFCELEGIASNESHFIDPEEIM